MKKEKIYINSDSISIFYDDNVTFNQSTSTKYDKPTNQPTNEPQPTNQSTAI